MGTLAVVALVGRMVLIFSMLTLVPLAFAWYDHDRGEAAFTTATLVTFTAGCADEPDNAPLPARTAAA
jgi:trk system potassium uptake protein TrkH